MEEVKQLLEKATRKRARDALIVEQRKLEKEIYNIQVTWRFPRSSEAIVPPMSSMYTVKISNYGEQKSQKTPESLHHEEQDAYIAVIDYCTNHGES